jgi:hypothetical protein
MPPEVAERADVQQTPRSCLPDSSSVAFGIGKIAPNLVDKVNNLCCEPHGPAIGEYVERCRSGRRDDSSRYVRLRPHAYRTIGFDLKQLTTTATKEGERRPKHHALAAAYART